MIDPPLARVLRAIVLIALTLPLTASAQSRMQRSKDQNLCLDGFCIGQTIADGHFNEVKWLIPTKDVTQQTCDGIGCQSQNEFRGYSQNEQMELSKALSRVFALNAYNLITNNDVAILRQYHYDCDPSAHGIGAQRRFVGFYRSSPSQYITLVGLRLINGELTVYRIARQYPYHTPSELLSLAKEVRKRYGTRVLLYNGISSNAPYDVIKQGLDGWFGRSTMFNPSDLADNDAELVLIDPRTRPLLQPTSMPDSGEISALPVKLPSACNSSTPLQ